MSSSNPSTLEIFYESWRGYQEKLRDCIAPLTEEQLRFQPAPGMWPLQQLAQHIISVRVGWFVATLQENDPTMNPYLDWGQWESPARSGAELAKGLDETWAFIDACMRRWSDADRAVTFPDEGPDGQIYQVSRSWVIYHVLEHDLHHGGEISSILGMHGLRAPDL